MSTVEAPPRDPPIVIESRPVNPPAVATTEVTTGTHEVAHTQTPEVGPPRREEQEFANARNHDAPEIVEAHEADQPTDSHALANAEHEEKGVAQLNHGETEVKDLGWNEPQGALPAPLVGGLENEELWTLIRRFNKQMYHVKALPEPPLGGLDLNIADEEEFSPDKLRANIERLYMTVIIGVVGFGKHIARLRSWRERNRTLAFMGVYFLAWAIDCLVPTIVAFFMILIAYPPSRGYCFPPAPIALIDSKTGGVTKPAAGVLGSDDSLTGAPEKHQGEAVEQEASNFVNSFTSIALSSATGKHPQGDPESDEKGGKLETGVPDPTNIAMSAGAAKSKTAGGNPSAAHDKTKEPMAAAMWSKTRPIMHAIADISDGWERFGNALSPTAPFPKEKPRLILASVLAPVLLITLFTNSYMFMKANGFFVGFGFFADPIIWRGLSYLNREFPNWQKLLEIRNTLLKGVPTNAQLTVTLLRIGEVNKAPLPPPPYSGPPPPDAAHATAGQDLEHLGVSDAEMNLAIHPDDTAVTTGTDTKAPEKKKHGRRLLAFVKSTTKGGVETMLGTDRLKASVGSTTAKNRLGVLQTGARDPAGPVQFPARFKGKKGHLYITSTATTPAISWTTEKEDIDPVFSIAIQDIQELKKIGGLGWKAKLVVGWATDREIADGILIVDKLGNQKQLTAIALREELFNRLVSMGNQMWEAW